ncbi:hypothetical protein MMC29_008082, partial [Sticta canariensis]|nr:hypothetical protein [Sticta canariensis]
MLSSRTFSSVPSPRRPASPDIWLAYAQKCSPGSLSSPLPAPRPASPDIWLAYAKKCSPGSLSSPYSAPRPSVKADSAVINAQLAANRAKIALVRFELNKLRRDVDRQFPEVSAGSRIPRARPSQTGSQVKPSFTRGRSLKPALKSILKPSASTKVAGKPVSACAGPIDFSGEHGLCEASVEVYAAPWRSFPAQEWANDKLPIERLDRCALRQQIKKCKLLAGGSQPRK